jgi:hypothetical protein
MDLCSIEDAFPNIDSGTIHKSSGSSGFPFVGGTDDKPTREERRAARKKAKKCKGPAATYVESQASDLPDPDRPAMKRLEEVESLKIQRDGFAMPQLPKASCLFSDTGTPAYFGRGDDDPVEEGYSPYSALQGDDPNYRLEPDFSKTFDFKGVEKVAGATLPEPNLDDRWKPMTPAASYTAFTNTAKKVGGGWAMTEDERRRPVEADEEGVKMGAKAPATDGASTVATSGSSARPEVDALLAKIDELRGRLEDLEKKRSQDTQKELLMFVGTGLLLLVSFELVSRR